MPGLTSNPRCVAMVTCAYADIAVQLAIQIAANLAPNPAIGASLAPVV